MTSSTKQQESTQQAIDQKVMSYWERMGKLNLLMGTITANDHKKGLEQAQMNQAAEANAVRKNVWGDEADEEAEAMGDQIVLGDLVTTNTQAAPPSPPGQPGSIAKTLAAAGLAAAGLGAGLALPIAAWQLMGDRGAEVAPITDTDTDTQYGLRLYKDG